jgi:catechol 2,3-dioxygenase-like lactoylglutathione lyase family enzyme
MFAYTCIGTNDVARARRFYDAVLAPLGLARHVANDDEVGYGPADAKGPGRLTPLYINRPYDGAPASFGNGTMLCFAAPSRAAVDAFHAAAMKAGGIDEGAPGLRPYGPTFYAAYVRDLDGNKLSAVFEG